MASVVAAAMGTHAAWAYTAPYATPSGITLVDVSRTENDSLAQFLWRRLGDADGNPLYTFDADQSGKSSCYDTCAKEFPPFVAEAGAKASGDWSIVVRDDGVRQWAYQGKGLYRYSGTDPVGEAYTPDGDQQDASWYDPTSKLYSPKSGWRRAAYTPEKSAVLPPDFALAAVGIANGFGLIDVESGMTVYAAPASRKLSSDWQAVRAPAVARPVGDFAIAVSKEDGSRQWTYKGEALYTFAGDYAAGDVNGLSSTDKGIQAALVYRNFIPSGLQINQYTGRGPLMTTRNGSTLYTVARYELLYGGRETRNGYHISYNDAKSQGTLGCRGDCTKTWKPVVASAHAQGWGLWEVVARPDGSKQWAFKGQPLYTYIGDKEPGDIRGNNRNVVVFGGAKGELVYADGGGDPHDPARVGDIAMTFAQGAVLRNPGPRGNGGAGLYWHTVGLVF